MTSRPSTAAPILAVLAAFAALLGAYIGGYYWLGEYTETTMGTTGPTLVYRRFTRPWQRKVFYPAGCIEQWLRDDS